MWGAALNIVHDISLAVGRWISPNGRAAQWHVKRFSLQCRSRQLSRSCSPLNSMSVSTLSCSSYASQHCPVPHVLLHTVLFLVSFYTLSYSSCPSPRCPFPRVLQNVHVFRVLHIVLFLMSVFTLSLSFCWTTFFPIPASLQPFSSSVLSRCDHIYETKRLSTSLL